MGKRIIFFDGDGTIWYPKKTKRSVRPFWIYSDSRIGKDHLDHLMLIPRTLSVLKRFRKKGIRLVIVSTHPHPPKEADLLLHGKVKHFKLDSIFDEWHTSRDVPGGKGKKMVQVLKRLGIPKRKALMVGDSYRFDYLAARAVGIDALLFKTPYMKHPRRGPRISRTIEDISEIPSMLGL